MTNILITGGCGFIGTLLTKSLLDLGHTVISIDPLETQIHGDKDTEYKHIDHPEYFHIRDRLENIAKYATDLENIKVVYHLASEMVPISPCLTPPSIYRLIVWPPPFFVIFLSRVPLNLNSCSPLQSSLR